MEAHNITACLWYIIIRQMKIYSPILQERPQKGSDGTDSALPTSLSNVLLNVTPCNWMLHFISEGKLNLFILLSLICRNISKKRYIFVMVMRTIWIPVIQKGVKYQCTYYCFVTVLKYLYFSQVFLSIIFNFQLLTFQKKKKFCSVHFYIHV